MKKILGYVCLVTTVFCFTSCGGSSSGSSSTGTAMAGLATCTAQSGNCVVCGRALAADGVTPLISAEVRLDSASASESPPPLASLTAKGIANDTQCLTDTSGYFACVVPSGTTGTQNFLVISSGFSNKTFSAALTTDSTTDVGSQTMTASTTTKWVVVPGAFDGVQVLLAQLKGCTLNNSSGVPFDSTTMNAADARASTDCTDKGLLVLDDSDPTSANYVTTFLAGSSLSSYDALYINCAADYHTTSGIDTAIQNFSNSGKHIYFSDLSDSWLTSAFPGVITFGTGSTIAGTIPAAEVPYAGLAAVVGSTISIIFDLPIWTDIDSVTSAVTKYIQGDISSLSPLTGTHPITVGWKPSSSTGCIFYTSYHIEGASTGASQELAIKYLVQNISSVCQ